jgi:hypothetical protein
MSDWTEDNPWSVGSQFPAKRGSQRGRATRGRGRIGQRGRGGGAPSSPIYYSSLSRFGLIPDRQLRYQPYRKRSGLVSLLCLLIPSAK